VVNFNLNNYDFTFVGRDSVLSIASHLGLDGPDINSLWGWNFPHPSRLTLGTTQRPIQGVPGLSGGGESSRGVAMTAHPV